MFIKDVDCNNYGTCVFCFVLIVAVIRLNCQLIIRLISLA